MDVALHCSEQTVACFRGGFTDFVWILAAIGLDCAVVGTTFSEDTFLHSSWLYSIEVLIKA